MLWRRVQLLRPRASTSGGQSSVLADGAVMGFEAVAAGFVTPLTKLEKAALEEHERQLRDS